MQIGRDPRISGPLLAAALAAGLTSKGVSVARFGYATTPAMFMSTIIEGVPPRLAVWPNLAVPSHQPYLSAQSWCQRVGYLHIVCQISAERRI